MEPFKRVILPGKYPGSKAGLMPYVWPHFPKHEHYVVLFGGIGGEILGKPRNISVMEPPPAITRDNVNACRVLMYQTEKLIEALCKVFFAKELYWEARDLLRGTKGSSFERARAWWIAANLCRGLNDPTSPRKRDPWGFAYGDHKNTSRWINIRQRLEAVATRFRGIQLDNQDWELIVDRIDSPTTLFSADPPYIAETLSTKTRFYTHEMPLEEHTRLLMRMRRIKGKAVIFGYPHERYNALLRDWKKLSIWRRVSLSAAKDKRVHDIFMNW